MTEVGSRIKKIRECLKLNQTDFAKKLNMSVSNVTISRYEANERKPNFDTLIAISKLGKVSLDWLITGKQKKKDLI